MLATISTASLTGLDSYRIEVEIDTAFGLPNFTIVGLGATAIQESRERVRSAVKNSGFAFPTHKITVNLAPAHVRKDGAQFDLPIAIGILVANAIVKPPSSTQLFIGELSLDGRTRSINGLLALILSVRELGFKELYIPAANQLEASLIQDPNLEIYPVSSLQELVSHLQGRRQLVRLQPRSIVKYSQPIEPDLSSVKGQDQAKRALVIAAAGGHNILLQGPPGSGKTLLARCLPSILPRLSQAELVDVTRLYSIANQLPGNGSLITARPFRSPHHTASVSAVIGGGAAARPGDITLAHHGVLFLDELPEFDRQVLESLRQPLEERELTVARVKASVRYPADFIFIGAANPCPCGYFGSTEKQCRCTIGQVHAYRKRLSGPLLDRIDLHLTIQPVKNTELTAEAPARSSVTIQASVERARNLQKKRYVSISKTTNSALTHTELATFCHLEPTAQTLVTKAVDNYKLSARAYYRVIKVAQTIADLEGSDMINAHHIAEACQYRPVELAIS